MHQDNLCKYCGNKVKQVIFTKNQVVKYCSDRCRFLSKGINYNSQLGLFLAENEILLTDFAEKVQEYQFIPYINMHSYVHKGISPTKRYRGLSGEEIAKSLLFTAHDIKPNLQLMDGRLDHRMFLAAGMNDKSTTSIPFGKGSELKRAISLTGSSVKTFGKEFIQREEEYIWNHKNKVTQTKYSLNAHNLYNRLISLYKANQETVYVPYGSNKVIRVLTNVLSRSVTLDSATAYCLARVLDDYDVNLDYRLLLEPITPSQIVLFKSKLPQYEE